MAMPAFAATQPVESNLSLAFSNYSEADIPRDRVVAGDTRRYDIDVLQFRLLAPVGRRWSFGLDVSRETMSGASPWATVNGVDGRPALIMSGATIHESRREAGASATRYGDTHSVTLSLTRSKENDYEAIAPSLAAEWTFNSGLTTLSTGVSYSSDDIAPTDAAAFGRIVGADRSNRSASVGIAHVIDRSSAIYGGLTATTHRGYLSDPYKLRDVRPAQRSERAFTLRYRRFLHRPDAALHLDYRFYHDDWNVDSHTLHTSWYQNLGPALQIVPNVRVYRQSEAAFYRPADDFGLPPDVHQSSDFRLSTFGAFTFGLKGIVRRPGWSMTFSADRYVGSEKLGLDFGSEHPARLSFTLVSVAFETTF